MRQFLPRLLSIGIDPSDDADLRLRKAISLAAELMVAPAALLWGAVYWFFGETTSALVPWA